MAAAGGDGDRFAGGILHAADALHVVAGRMQAFHGIAQGEAVLDGNFHQAAGGVEGDGIADILALVRFGVAAQVVLVIGVVVALVETVGVTAIGQVLQFAEQTGIEGAAGDGVVDGLAVGLAGAGDVVGALGASGEVFARP